MKEIFPPELYEQESDGDTNFPRVGNSLLWLLLFVVVYFIGGMLYFIIVDLVADLLKIGLSIEAERAQALIEPLLKDPTGSAGIYFVQFSLLVPVLLLASNFQSQPWRETLNLKPFTLKSLGFWLLILAAYFLVHALFNSIFGDASTEFLKSVSGSKNLWFALQTIVLAPILEELLFRGYLFKAWRHSRLGLTGTLLLTSILFTGAHWGQWHWKLLAPIFLVSVILGLAREKTGSVWVPVILHGICNLISAIFLVYN